MRPKRNDFSELSLEFSSYVEMNLDDFLQRTYITPAVKFILNEIKERLEGKENDSFFLLDSRFGSGKTHALITVYETFKDQRIICLDGHSIHKSIWEEIAAQIGCKYETQEQIIKEVFAEKVIILMDELVVYLKKAKAIKIGDTNLSELSIAFLHTLLIESKKHRAAILMTVPGEEGSYEEESKLVMEKLRSISLRQSTIIEVNKTPELWNIVSKQIFEKVPEEGTYPFNKNFIDFIAYELVPIVNFQAIRGALRLLIKFIEQANKEAYLWGLGDVKIESIFYEEIVVKLGKESLGEVMQRDLTHIPVELHPAARVIFFYTITRGGITRNELIDHLIEYQSRIHVEKQLEKLELYSHYIHNLDGTLCYKIEATALKQLKNFAETLGENEVKSYLNKRIKQIMKGNDLKFHIFKVGSIDPKKPNILVEVPGHSEMTLQLKNHKLRNVLFTLSAKEKEEIMRLSALELAGEKKKREEFKEVLVYVKQELENTILSSYTILNYLSKGEITTTEISFSNASSNPHTNLKDELIAKHLVIDKLNPEYLEQIISGKPTSLSELVETFARDSRQRVLLSSEVLHDALRKGATEQRWKYQDLKITPYSVREEDDDGKLETVFINASEFSTLHGKIIHDYSYTYSGVSGSDELFRTLGLLKLMNSQLNLNCSIEIQGENDKRIKISFEEHNISTLYLSMKRINPSFKEFHSTKTKISIQVNDFRRTRIDDRLVKSLEGIHKLGGEIFVTVENKN